ncbi:hypothetical protein BpHYR1_035630 [Brachionus plicatilis]|uniref:Uncharacterized protein n=1 Tax=Brachionus plicatilis TaxID=10195 RepID=A0A3M7RQM3_BRAPC|nr:hypothetical protein BpHYR1_035630 [Brachionus plicatilis]
MVLGIEQVLEPRRYELFAGKVDHYFFVIESFGAYALGAIFGVLDHAKVDERLTLVAVDEYLLDGVVAVRAKKLF